MTNGQFLGLFFPLLVIAWLLGGVFDRLGRMLGLICGLLAEIRDRLPEKN